MFSKKLKKIINGSLFTVITIFSLQVTADSFDNNQYKSAGAKIIDKVEDIFKAD